MQFVFNGTLNELKEIINLKTKEHNKDIVIYDNKPNTLEIGFQRIGHSSGRFFIANIIEEDKKVILDGEIKNVFPNQKENRIGYLWDEFTGFLFAYIILEAILVIPWLFFKNFISVWIPIILPFVYLIIRHFLNRKEEDKSDKGFIDFMSLCAVYILEEPRWDEIYKNLDLAQGKLKTICDDDQDMLLITYEDGMQIDVGYIAEDKTYYITVVSSDTNEAWNNPLGEFAIKDKAKLPGELQKIILKFRNVQM